LERVNERVSADTAVGRASSLSASHEGSGGGKKGKELGHFEDLVGVGFGWKRWLFDVVLNVKLRLMIDDLF